MRHRRSAAIGLALALLGSVTGGATAATASTADSTPPAHDRGRVRAWYVATDGDDDGAGTSADPFASWQRGIDAARRGDRVVIRPGTYSAGPGGVKIPHSGTRSAPIVLEAADPADRPVLDCAGLDDDQLVCVEIDGRLVAHLRASRSSGRRRRPATPRTPCSWTRRATTRSTTSPSMTTTASASRSSTTAGTTSCATATPTATRTSEPSRSRTRTVTASTSGSLHPSGVGNRVVGCRMWWNADDGIDLWESEAAVEIRRCWSFRNGYLAGTTEPAGNGQGYKLGRSFDGAAARAHAATWRGATGRTASTRTARAGG